MAAIHIRKVPEDVVTALKRRAARNERSLEGELRQILRSIASQELEAQPLAPLSLHLSGAGDEASWGREDVYGDDGW